MNIKKTINLEIFRKVIEESADDLKKEQSKHYLSFDYAGIIPNDDETFRYDLTPKNTIVFATTGGDGVHYSIFEISDSIQPIIMTVPMNYRNSSKDCNIILAENLNEFLSIGFYKGWFSLEQICYDYEGTIQYYADTNEELNEEEKKFIKNLRSKIDFPHIPLKKERLIELESKYYEELIFDNEY
ncbi:hypothetical protein [Emticicia sp. SJ17W-69]|uniref:hypothetical protein n=1 Tax=Emticicia sp. SJ17W-69 TaxID=3421657 RepID=UPI003EBD86B6